MPQQFSPLQEESRGVPIPSDIFEEESKKRHFLRQKAVMLPFRVNLIVLAMTEMGLSLEDFFEKTDKLPWPHFWIDFLSSSSLQMAPLCSG